MGPVVLLDKSALQGLSRDEVGFLYKHYTVMIPKVLLTEILADLSKEARTTGRFTPEIVGELAEKIWATNTYVAADHRELCFADLISGPIPRARRVPVRPGRRIRGPDGRPAMFFAEPAEMKALRHWRRGEFHKSDVVASVAWRIVSQAFNSEQAIERLARVHVVIPRCTSLHDAAVTIEAMLANPRLQLPLLTYLCEEFSLRDPRLQSALTPYLRRPDMLISEFAPYAAHCLRSLLMYAASGHFGLTSIRPTNRIDLEYCFYLPFCHAVSSRDRFHTRVIPWLLDTDQTFVPGDALKRDLRAIRDDWHALSEADKEDRAYHYGDYPPRLPSSVTTSLWDRHMAPWRPGSGNTLSRMTSQQKASLSEHVKKIVAAIESQVPSDPLD